ncbi:MAG: ribonuclease R family protein [Leptospirales bacterium]
MKETFQNILYKLKRTKGSKIPISVLTSRKPENTGEDKSRNQRKGPSAQSRDQSKQQSGDTVSRILSDLENFGLLKSDNKHLFPKHPFLIEARLSVAPSGVSFAAGAYDTDIVVPRQKRRGALHRDKVWVELTGFSRGRYEGRVASIIEPFSTRFLAKIKKPMKEGYLIVLNDLPDSPFGLLATEREFSSDDYVIVEESGETRDIPVPANSFQKKRGKGDSFYQEVTVFEYLETLVPGTLASDTKRVALRFNIPIDYDESLIPKKRELKKLAKTGKKQEGRKDLTKLFTCTIDGADSKDFDDAISLVEKDGVRTLYVHIADVSHFIEPGSPLDTEAIKRGNSYYLGHSVFPMLPPIVSEEFCSLNPKTKRLAFTAEMRYDENAKLIGYEIYKSFIQMNKRYTYEMAESELDNKKSPISAIWKLAKQLNTLRVKDGKVELNIKETKIVSDAHGRIKAMDEKVKLLSYKLIEECMLSANTCTAHFMRKRKIPGIYRVHDPLPKDNIKRLNDFLELYGFKTRLKDGGQSEILRVLTKLEATPYGDVFQNLLLRSFSQAIYSVKKGGHWGLGFEDYTHFTSPIRRYSDLIVHRQIAAAISGKTPSYSTNEAEHIARETSRLERIAMEAEKATLRLLSIRYMQDRVGDKFSARFSGYNSNGIFIALDDPKMDGFIAYSDMRGKEPVPIDDFRVSIPRFGKTISLGQKLFVRLRKADWENLALMFELLSIGKLGS